MKIALIGYGKMGKEIEKLAIERGHSIEMIIDIDNPKDIKSERFKNCDAAIEFTVPSAVLANIYACFDAKVPIVTGTTGWHNELESVSRKCKEGNNALFHSSNFSIGVNLFFALNEFAANLMNNFNQYEVSIKESHHIHKLDAPSGTAISIAEILLNKLDRKNSWKPEHGKEDEIAVSSVREGEITGIHDVLYESDADYIELKHFAKTRKGFALGAIIASEFIQNKAGIFTMRDLLGV